MFKRSILLTAAVIAAAALFPTSAQNQPGIFRNVDKAKMERWVNDTFKSMTPDERIAQIMVQAVNPQQGDAAKGIVDKLVGEYKVGGLIYNETDIITMANLTNYAQMISDVPLMITLDAEWGPSMRLEDAPKFPRNLYIGAIDDDKLFYDYGKEVARECYLMGVNVNFAPVLDVVDRNGSVVGRRSYGSDPDAVARHGIAFARGMEDNGVLSVAKHFPGHGGTTADSHKTLPTVNKSRQEMERYDLEPFKRYINAGLSGMLTAHIYVPCIDEEMGPATMSRKHVNDLLRKKMHFNGLIFTDALQMEGAKATSGSVCVNAILAGNDILLMPSDVGQEIQAIKAAIADGTLRQSDVDERCKKMLRFKYALNLTKKPMLETVNLVERMNAPEAEVLARKLTAASITVVKNEGEVLPVKNLDKTRIAVVTVGNENGDRSVFARRCADYAQVSTFNFNGNLSSIEAHLDGGNYDLLIVSVAKEGADYSAVAQMLADHAKKTVVAIMCDPERLNSYAAPIVASDKVDAALIAYRNDTNNEDYLAQTIFGGNAARGKLPVYMTNGTTHYAPGTGLKYDAMRLGYNIPAAVGFDERLIERIDSVCNYGVQQHAFPGCQVVVARHGQVVVNRAYGEIDYNTDIPVTTGTLYGLASVSKATGTLSCVMKTVDEGLIGIDHLAAEYIPGLRGTDKDDITVRDLLYHETGLPPSLSMWEMMFDPSTYEGKLITTTSNEYNTIKIMNNAYGNYTARLRTDILSTMPTPELNIAIAEGLYGGKVTYDSIMNRIYHANLGQKKYLYSCLNFCLLANAVQNVTGMQLNDYAQQNVFGPLGAYHTMYRPLEKFPQADIAYTEVDTYLRRQHIHGYVHDELAAFSGGVQGNAGLFSNANDLAKLFQMWLNGGTYGGQRFLSEKTVETFITDKSPRSHRGLGFDKPVVGDPDASNTCEEATPETIGHTGFTGTCFWVDPANDMIYIFLSNRVSPTRNNPNFSRVSARSHIHSILYKSIVK